MQRKRGLGARDRPQDRGLRCAIGEPPVGEADPADPHQGDEESDDRREDTGSALQFPDRPKQFFLVSSRRLDGDDGAEAPVLPGGDRRARNFEATTVAAASLAADLKVDGSASITGVVTSAGTDAVRRITSAGDIFVQGTLRGADLGTVRQGLTLEAPAGTVYVSGTIDTSGAPGGGQAGGPLTINAQRVVMLGNLLAAGGDGSTAGAAGSISISTSGGTFVSGVVAASGGNAQGVGATLGGKGGALAVKAGGDIILGGTVRVRGGLASGTDAADARAGDAGSVTVDCSGTAAFTGTLDGRGGTASAKAAGGAVTGGAGGALKVGESVRPSAIGISLPVLLRGGDGAQAGGDGGHAQLEPHGGDLRIAGTLDVSGGSSATKPGGGGKIDGNPGPELTTAGVDVSGQVIANGGSATGAVGDGGAGGVIKLVVLSSDGNMTLEPAGQVQTDGGKSAGSGAAGGGGLMYLFTMDGNASLHGKLLARGGAAPDPGGRGGGGGFVYVFTDNNHGGTHGGVLIIETDGLIDASGGAGTIGGSARNDGIPHTVAIWPVHQDDEYDVQQTAVLINSDGKHGPATGWIDNRGHVVARGGPSNGAGGDVQYHGKRQDGNETPLPGNIDQAGDGTGAPGDFAGE